MRACLRVSAKGSATGADIKSGGHRGLQSLQQWLVLVCSPFYEVYQTVPATVYQFGEKERNCLGKRRFIKIRPWRVLQVEDTAVAGCTGSPRSARRVAVTA